MVIKKIKGRKRHIVVDSLGQLLAIKVHTASQYDSKGGMAVLDEAVNTYPSLKMICGDQGYQGSTTLHVIKDLKREMMISSKITGKKTSPKRWIVERTFGWLGWYRRLSKDYEKLRVFAENMVRISMICIEVRKLNID